MTAALLRPRDVAPLFDVAPKEVTRWADKGLVPVVVTAGGHRRFRPEDIAALRPPAIEPPDRLLRPGAVALALGVSPKRVVRWADQGRLPCYRTPGGHRRFKQSEVVALLALLEQGEPMQITLETLASEFHDQTSGVMRQDVTISDVPDGYYVMSDAGILVGPFATAEDRRNNLFGDGAIGKTYPDDNLFAKRGDEIVARVKGGRL